MKTNTLISNQTIFDNTNLSGNIESKKLRPSILLAQDTKLQDLLGSDLYNFIYDHRTVAGVYTGLTSTQTTFIDTYMTPTLMYYAVGMFVRTHYIEISNIGVMKNQNETAQSIELKEAQSTALYYEGLADFYAARLHKWMCDQRNLNNQDEIFTLYSGYDQNLNPSQMTSDFGIYFPSEKNCGCETYNCVCGR